MASSKSSKKVSEKKNKKTTTKQTQKQNQKQVVNVTINNQKQSAARKTTSKSSSSRKPPLNPIISPIQGMRVLDTFPPPPPKIFEASNNDVINAINSVPSTLAGLINTQLSTGSARPKPVTPRITPRITTQPTPPAITPRDTPIASGRASPDEMPSFGAGVFESPLITPKQSGPPIRFTPTTQEVKSANVLQRAIRGNLARKELNRLAKDEIENTDMMRARAIKEFAKSPRPIAGQYTLSPDGRSFLRSPTPSSIQPPQNPQLKQVFREAARYGWNLSRGGTDSVSKRLTSEGKFDLRAQNRGRPKNTLRESLLKPIEPESTFVNVNLSEAKSNENSPAISHLTPRKTRSGTRIGD